MKDTFNRSIDYLRISLTDRCNLRCVYCMPKKGVESIPHESILTLEEFVRIIKVLSSAGIKHVRFTGGEPLVRKGLISLIEQTAAIKDIDSIALTTNAILLPSMANDLKKAGLARVNISLDTLDENQYRLITRRGNLSDALLGIQSALEHDFAPVKLNTVVVRSLKQDLLSFVKLTIDQPLHVRFIEYMPVGEGANCGGCGWGIEEVVPAQEILAIINQKAQEAGLETLQPLHENAPLGWGPAAYYKLPNSKGSIGVISAVSKHFCASCNRLRLTSDGKLKPCLFSDLEYDLRKAVRSGSDEDILTLFSQAITMKPEGHQQRVGTKRMMSQVGG